MQLLTSKNSSTEGAREESNSTKDTDFLKLKYKAQAGLQNFLISFEKLLRIKNTTERISFFQSSKETKWCSAICSFTANINTEHNFLPDTIILISTKMNVLEQQRIIKSFSTPKEASQSHRVFAVFCKSSNDFLLV